jgi:large subunit ribosomal protein L25
MLRVTGEPFPAVYLFLFPDIYLWFVRFFTGASTSGKSRGFGPRIRRFESFRPSHPAPGSCADGEGNKNRRDGSCIHGKEVWSVDIIQLKARPRNGAGKSYTRKIRTQGWIPAVYYGIGREPTAIEVDKKEFSAAFRGRKLTHLFDLGLSGKEKTSMAVVREVQRHVINNDLFLNIDFQHVAMDKKVTIDCPLDLTGIPIGVKDAGGVLGRPVKTLTIECMPTEIPEKISIDVSHLEIGDSIHVRDVKVPNVVIKASPDEVLAVVTQPTREEEAAKPAEEAVAAEGVAAAVPGTAPAAPGAAPAAPEAAAPAAPEAAPKGKTSKEK